MKSSTLADLRPMRPLRFGPVSLRVGSNEWQAAHCSNTALPRVASCAEAVCEMAIALAMAIRWHAYFRCLIIVLTQISGPGFFRYLLRIASAAMKASAPTGPVGL